MGWARRLADGGEGGSNHCQSYAGIALVPTPPTDPRLGPRSALGSQDFGAAQSYQAETSDARSLRKGIVAQHFAALGLTSLLRTGVSFPTH